MTELMKKLFYIIIALVAVACFASCEKENPVVTPAKKLAVVSSDLAFESTGGTGTIVVEAEEAVSATSDKPWAQVSVSGKTITVTCGAWTQLESRNAKITVKSGNESLDITAIQTGVVFYLDGTQLSDDLILTGKGNTYNLPFTANTSITDVKSNADWLAASWDNASNSLIVTTQDNTEMATRHGSVSVTLGNTIMEYSVVQYPPFVETKDWSMSYVKKTESATQFKCAVKASHGYYAPDCISAGEYASVNMEGPAFIEHVMVPRLIKDIEDAIQYYGGRYGWTSFLYDKDATLNFSLLDDGDYVGIMVGFDKDGYPTGYYSISEIYVGDVEVTLTPYQKWVGNWKLSGKNIEGAAYEEIIQIMADPNDVDESGAAKETSLIVRGLCSKNQEAAGVTVASGNGDMYLTYDKETQSITFTGQNGTKKFTNSDKGDNCSLQLISMYVKAGATSYTNVTGGSFMQAVMNEDGRTTTITVLDRSAGLPYKAFRMRLLNASGSAYTIGGNAATISLDGISLTKQ